MKCFAPFIKGEKAFPCGQCFSCRSQRVREWAMRCEFELRYWNDARFLTLTYDNEHLPKDFSLHKSDLQKFFKRLRKRVPLFKYFACGEYGSRTKRPHYHAIVFGLGEQNRDDVVKSWRFCDPRRFYLGKCFEAVNRETINYVCGYIRDKLTGKLAEKEYEFVEKPFNICSKGLGRDYFIDNKMQILEQGYVLYRGKPCSIPRFIIRDWREEDMPITRDFIKQLDVQAEKNSLAFSEELHFNTHIPQDFFPADAYRDRKKRMHALKESFDRSYPNKHNFFC